MAVADAHAPGGNYGAALIRGHSTEPVGDPADRPRVITFIKAALSVQAPF